MSIYKPADPSIQPETTLIHWKLFKTLEGGTHLCGLAVEDSYNGRVSSKIQSIDREQNRIVTRSGRVYRLSGASGSHADAEYVLAAWFRINKLNADSIRYVTLAEVP